MAARELGPLAALAGVDHGHDIELALAKGRLGIGPRPELHVELHAGQRAELGQQINLKAARPALAVKRLEGREGRIAAVAQAGRGVFGPGGRQRQQGERAQPRADWNGVLHHGRVGQGKQGPQLPHEQP